MIIKKYFTTLIISMLVIPLGLLAQNKSYASYQDLLDQSNTKLYQQFEDFQSSYILENNEYAWNYDKENSTITLTQNELLHLTIHFIHVGNVNVANESWHWSWDESNTNWMASDSIQTIRTLGQKEGFEKLANTSWKGGEEEAWEMVAISNFLLDGLCAARHYTKEEYNYVIFTQIVKHSED